MLAQLANVRLPGLTPVPVCQELAQLAAAVPADQAIVEIGVYKGRTACWLGAGARSGYGAHVWAVDPWDLPGDRRPYNYCGGSRKAQRIRAAFTSAATRQRAAKAVADCGLTEQVTLVRGFGQDYARGWSGPAVGLLYVDGDHNVARGDIDAWWPHLAADAVIAVDDYEPRFDKVVADVDQLVASGLVAQFRVHHGRLAVMRRAR